MSSDRSPDIVRTAFVSTYPPRKCGIASYTSELGRVTADREIVALHPLEPIAPYAFEVHHRIRRDERDDYARVAASLERCADVVSIQFDDGIWGGEDGESVLDFVGALSLPAVATLHTIHHDPTERQHEILLGLVRSARAVVVMSQAAASLLTKDYGIEPELIDVIPYGVPDLPIMDSQALKSSLGLDDREVILSLGLLGPFKGYEQMVDALPAVVAKHPTAMYVIVGATHPDVVRRDGEAYRESLAARAAKLGVTANIRFVSEFVGRNDLTRWLQAADVFVTPTPDPGTIRSGSLAHAMAAGRAIVSTRFAYAEELLADDRGILVTADPGELASGVLRLLDDAPLRTEMGARAHEHARQMSWSRVGADHQRLFERVTASLPPANRGTGRSVRSPLSRSVSRI